MESLGPAVRRVLSRYAPAVDPQSIEPLGSGGGLSGAQLWRVGGAAGEFCLRRWPPEHPSESLLLAIHRVLRNVYASGVTEVAVPIPDAKGHTFIRESGSLWELAPWLPGTADYAQAPSPARLTAALRLLARFHLAAASPSSAKPQSPVGLVQRREQLRSLIDGGYVRLSQAARSQRGSVTSEVIETCSRQFVDAFPVLANRILPLLEEACVLSVPLQPCIRDVRHDHLLFTGDVVTGLIDFGAMRDDHVACDLSRLLGSLVQDDPAGWELGLSAYEQLRPLTPADYQLITAYDRSAVLLSAMNWLQWLFVERIEFEDATRVERRCREIAGRLDRMRGER